MIPPNATGLVLFAHGSGSGRNSPRNKLVSQILNKSGIATLLLDLLTEYEEKIDLETKEFRFNIPLLIERLVIVIDEIRSKRETRDLDIGIFGSSTGSASAIVAAQKRSNIVRTVVSRGGRVDLARKYCEVKNIRTPILLIVGDKDPVTLEINQKLFNDVKSVESSNKKLTIIPGATHLFEEQGKLEQVSRLAASWFRRFLTK